MLSNFENSPCCSKSLSTMPEPSSVTPDERNRALAPLAPSQAVASPMEIALRALLDATASASNEEARRCLTHQVFDLVKTAAAPNSAHVPSPSHGRMDMVGRGVFNSTLDENNHLSDLSMPLAGVTAGRANARPPKPEPSKTECSEPPLKTEEVASLEPKIDPSKVPSLPSTQADSHSPSQIAAGGYGMYDSREERESCRVFVAPSHPPHTPPMSWEGGERCEALANTPTPTESEHQSHHEVLLSGNLTPPVTTDPHPTTIPGRVTGPLPFTVNSYRVM